MGKRLYVGNLPYQCDEAQLRALFEQEGRQVEEVKIVTDRETGRPRGFAFVELATDAQAQAAVTALNGKPFGGRPLTVSEARERAPGRGGRAARRPVAGGGWPRGRGRDRGGRGRGGAHRGGHLGPRVRARRSARVPRRRPAVAPRERAPPAGAPLPRPARAGDGPRPALP